MHSIPNGYEEAWASEILQEFQNTGFRLRGTARTPESVSAEKIHWRIVGKGKAHKRTRGSTKTKMNAALNIVSADPAIYDAADYVYQEDLMKMTPNMKDTLNTVILNALGRKFDALFIDEFAAQTYDAAHTIGTSANVFDLVQAKRITQKLMKFTEMTPGPIFCAIPSNPWDKLMNYDQFTSGDYVKDTPYARMSPETRVWNQVTWIPFPDSALKPDDTATDITFYAWHRDAIGFGDLGEVKPDVWWNGEVSGWLHTASITGAVKVLQPEGVLKITVKDE